MKRYDLRSIMKKAWDFFHKTGKSFAECLKMAWFNVKQVEKARNAAGTDEICHTWYGWKSLGYEVIHESKALYKAIVMDARTKKGTRVLSYFGSSQVAEITA